MRAMWTLHIQKLLASEYCTRHCQWQRVVAWMLWGTVQRHLVDCCGRRMLAYVALPWCGTARLPLCSEEELEGELHLTD